MAAPLRQEKADGGQRHALDLRRALNDEAAQTNGFADPLSDHDSNP